MFKVFFIIVFLSLKWLPLQANPAMIIVPLNSGYTETDSVRVNYLNHQCWTLRRTDPKSAIIIGKKSLEMARKIGYKKGEAQILNYLGVCYLKLLDYSTASEYFFNALAFSDSLGIGIEKGYALNNIASSLRYEGEYRQSLNYNRKALALQTQNKDKKGIAYALLRTSDAHYYLQEYDSVLITAQKAYDLFLELGLKENSLVALKNMGRAREGKKQYNKALNCYLEIISSEAISQDTEFDICVDLSRVYNLLNLPDQSILYGEKWIRQHKYNDLICKNISNAYALKGDWEKAYEYSQMSISVRDSLDKDEKFTRIKNLQILYETRETEKENLDLKARLNVNKIYIVTFGLVILLIGLLLMILQSKRRQQTKLNRVLNQKNEEISTQRDHLDELNQTKDKLFSIIAHDLRGPIGSTSAFLEELTANENEFTKEELHDNLILLKDSSNATFKLLENLLTWALAQRGEIVFHPVQNDFLKIVQSNIDLFASNAENKKIQIINEIDHPLIFDFDLEMINTVVRNLLNNAIKYTSENGRIIISATESDENINIFIKDTGIGMDSETAKLLFNTDAHLKRTEGTRGEKGTGLGLILCKEFVQKHLGTIRVESEAGIGSTFHIKIPKKTVRAKTLQIEQRKI